jgi:hypothetical protein
VNLYIKHNRRTPLQAEEALGLISIPRVSRGIDPFKRTSASMAEKPGAYSTLGTNSGVFHTRSVALVKLPITSLFRVPWRLHF